MPATGGDRTGDRHPTFESDPAATVALGNHDHQANWQREKHEHALLASADDELSVFIKQIHAERDRLSNWRLLEDTRRELVTIGYDIATGPVRKLQVRDNSKQLGGRVHALAELEHEAHRLASTKADFAADLERLWNALPDGRFPVEA